MGAAGSRSCEEIGGGLDRDRLVGRGSIDHGLGGSPLDCVHRILGFRIRQPLEVWPQHTDSTLLRCESRTSE